MQRPWNRVHGTAVGGLRAPSIIEHGIGAPANSTRVAQCLFHRVVFFIDVMLAP